MVFLSSCLYFFYAFAVNSYNELDVSPLLIALLFSLIHFVMLSAAAKYFYNCEKYLNESRTVEKVILVLGFAFIGGRGFSGNYIGVDTVVFCVLYIIFCVLFMGGIYKSYDKLGIYSDGSFFKGLADSTFERREGLDQIRVAGCFIVAIPFLSFFVWAPLK